MFTKLILQFLFVEFVEVGFLTRLSPFIFMFSCIVILLIIFVLDIDTDELGSVYPTSQAVYAGSNVVIICNSKTTPKWSKVREENWNFSVMGNNLVLIDVKEKDNGYYICQGTRDSETDVFKARSELLVGGKW